jgi:hypothetical protein
VPLPDAEEAEAGAALALGKILKSQCPSILTI